MTTEDVAGRIAFFHEQIHVIHWNTKIFAEHKATGSFYEYLQDFKDDVVEKLMGYTGKRVKSFKIEPVSMTVDAMDIVDQVLKFAEELMNWADSNKYLDVSNMSQDLSGQAAKMKYLLTLS